MDNIVDKIMKKIPSIQDKELVELIKDLLEERRYLTEIANLDTLTGLYNRRIINHIRNCSVFVIFDIDHFKSVNDTYGHDVGDDIIKQVAKIAKENVRFNDYIFRFGGDEFCIAFTDVNKEIVKERLERIQNQIRKNVNTPNPNHKITISIGMVENLEDEEIESLMKKADVALYKSKSSGRDRITEFKNLNNNKILH